MTLFSYIISAVVGVAVLGYFVYKRHDAWGEWPSVTDCLIVWAAVTGIIQAALTAFAVLQRLWPDITFDAIALLGYGVISGIGLAAKEIQKKFKGQ